MPSPTGGAIAGFILALITALETRLAIMAG